MRNWAIKKAGRAVMADFATGPTGEVKFFKTRRCLKH